MTDSLPLSIFPLVNLQADHVGKRISNCRWTTQAKPHPKEDQRESAGLHAWKNDEESDLLP